MPRSVLAAALVVAGALALAHCGESSKATSPSAAKPASTTGSSAGGTVGPTPGTDAPGISLVTSTPAAGGVVTPLSNSQPPASIDASQLNFTFTVSAPETLTGAQLQVDLFDKFANVCGQLFTTPQDLVARRATTVSTQGIAVNWFCPIPVAIVSLNASLYKAAAGTKTTYIGETFHDAITVQRPTASVLPGSGGLTLQSSFPEPGGTIGVDPYHKSLVIEPNLNLTFGVLSDVTIPGAVIVVQLFDAGGTQCGGAGPVSLLPTKTVTANVPTTVTLTQVTWTGLCSFPATTSRLTATLQNSLFPSGVIAPGPGCWEDGCAITTVFIVQSFPVGFTFTPYPAPPAGAPQTAPVISSLRCPTCGHVFFDNPTVICDAYEVDGAPVTVRIDWRLDNGTSGTKTVAFSAGESALSRTVPYYALIRGAELVWGITDPDNKQGKKPAGTITCTATNDRGQSATMTIPKPGIF